MLVSSQIQGVLERDQHRYHRVWLLGPEPGAQLCRNARGQGRCRVRPRHRQTGAGAAALPRGQDHHRLSRAAERQRRSMPLPSPRRSARISSWHGRAAGRQARLARKADDRDLGPGPATHRRGAEAQPRAAGGPHLHLHRRGAQDERAHRQRRVGQGALLRLDPRQPGPVPARRERDLGPGRPRLLDPRLSAGRAPGRGVGQRHQPLPRHAGEPGLHHAVLRLGHHRAHQRQLARAGQGAADPTWAAARR